MNTLPASATVIIFQDHQRLTSMPLGGHTMMARHLKLRPNRKMATFVKR